MADGNKPGLTSLLGVWKELHWNAMRPGQTLAAYSRHVDDVLLTHAQRRGGNDDFWSLLNAKFAEGNAAVVHALSHCPDLKPVIERMAEIILDADKEDGHELDA